MFSEPHSRQTAQKNKGRCRKRLAYPEYCAEGTQRPVARDTYDMPGPHRHRAHEHPWRSRPVLSSTFAMHVLIEDSWNPEFEACRVLVARGITGRLETWRTGKTHPDMIAPDIEEGARWTVVEKDKEGQRPALIGG